MKIRRIGREEDGAVAVVVALTMTVLFAFSAMAVDFGMMANCKQSLQNAADAAALAAAADLGVSAGAGAANASAAAYCTANGFDPSAADVTMTVHPAGKTVTVTLQREMPMGFSAVATGVRTRPVSATAKAEAVSIFGGCPYAMFAGQRIEDDGHGIAITGNDIAINGNIHSNSDISMKHAVLGPGVVATAVRTVNPSTTGWNGNSIALDMPSFRSFESALTSMSELVVFPTSVTKNNQTGFQELLNEAIHKYHQRNGPVPGYLSKGLFIRIEGDLTFNGHHSTSYTAHFPIILVVDGDINLNGAPLDSTADSPISIMSANGDITVNGGGSTFTGILYAPNGDVTLNGNDAEFVGSIVAQNIRKAGGKITVSYNEDVDRFLPTTKVHLIA